MSKMIQVRNVPDRLHRRLKARAALEGRSLSDYILVELERVAERPTRQELLERLGQTARADVRPSPAEILRAERDSR
jgi:plasmid stability protein